MRPSSFFDFKFCLLDFTLSCKSNATIRLHKWFNETMNTRRDNKVLTKKKERDNKVKIETESVLVQNYYLDPSPMHDFFIHKF